MQSRFELMFGLDSSHLDFNRCKYLLEYRKARIRSTTAMSIEDNRGLDVNRKVCSPVERFSEEFFRLSRSIFALELFASDDHLHKVARFNCKSN